MVDLEGQGQGHQGKKHDFRSQFIGLHVMMGVRGHMGQGQPEGHDISWLFYYQPRSREIMHLEASVCPLLLKLLNRLTYNLDIWHVGRP